MREAPQTLFPKLFKAWKISHLVFEKDVDGYGWQRDQEIMKLAKDAGVEVVIKTGRTLYDSDELVKKNGGKPTMSISQVQKAGEKLEIPRPIPAPTSLPDPGDTKLDFEHTQPGSEPDFNGPQRQEPNKSYCAIAGPNGDFSPPTLEELGLPAATTPHHGGETNGLKELEAILADKDYTATFAKPNTAPTAFAPRATTVLSPHMHFGSLSCREFYWRVQDIVTAYKGQATGPPTSLTGQLLFRDMYFGAQAAQGFQFSQTFGNSHCRFVPWHLPSKIDSTTRLITGAYDVDSQEAETWFLRWKYGRTGFPWIDALMRQLRAEGWIHHLGRHAVACFLTRGGCYVDWERGAEVFEEWLIDHETACNTGNWQWLSCTAFYAQFYRCYSPIAFPQKTDKEGNFVREYVPELKHFDKKFIYEPWKAPIVDQKKWGCLVKGDGGAEEGQLDEPLERIDGKDVYPKAMFDFPQRREICIQGLKNAYRVGLYGNSPKVLDGTWRELFDDSAEGPTEGTDGPIGAMIEDDHGDGEAHPDHDDLSPKKKRTKHARSESTGQGPMDKHIKKTKK